MNINEYEKIKNYTYLEYCDYLQNKYGIGKSNYMSSSWYRINKVSRSGEGLFAHHKYEDHAAMLATKFIAQQNPFEWQLAQNIVYCDFLEHLFLHILITEYATNNDNVSKGLGIGGVVNFIVPELNDLYSGFEIKQKWKQTCFDLVKDDKKVYLTLIKRFMTTCSSNPYYKENDLFRSYSEMFGYDFWFGINNVKLYNEISEIKEGLKKINE